jgi:DNA polymerase-1
VPACTNGHAPDPANFSDTPPGTTPKTPKTSTLLVRDPTLLQTVLQALDESELVGVDTETTGLSPRTDRVRLLQLATDRDVCLIDLFAVPSEALASLWPLLAEKEIVGHNLSFDLQFLAALGFAPGAIHDTMVLSQLLHGTRQPRGFHTLKEVAKRILAIELDKSSQASDWSGVLTDAQLNYAATDAAVLVPLYRALTEQIKEARLQTVAEIESRCLPAVAWMAGNGVAFDQASWNELARQAAIEAENLLRQLDEAAPPRPDRLPGMPNWNWSSPRQVKAVFALVGVELASTADDALAGIQHPLVTLLRAYRAAEKRAGTYGPEWIKAAYHEGRLYPGWKQVGSDAGRMSCAEPNAQNLPRDPRYRRCFKAPEGRLLIKADYSQIELRIAAKVSGDAAMLDAYRRGEDLHTQTARRVLGAAEVTKQHRQHAKAVNFGFVYGMGAKGFRVYALSQYGLDLSLEQATQYRQGFFEAYLGLVAWHRRVKRQHAPQTRTLAGRRRLLDVKTSDTLRLNSPVQGTGADGLKLALALLWERRDQCPGAFPVLAVHDEIVVECGADQAEAAAAWLKAAMIDGMAPLIDPVPVEVEIGAATNWAKED